MSTLGNGFAASGTARGLLAALIILPFSMFAGYWLATSDALALEGLVDHLTGLEVLVLTAIAVPLPLFLHEAGHLIGGMAAGFGFALYVAGPLMVYRTGSGIRARFHRYFSLYGGLAACAPRGDQDLLRKMVWMTVAGPVMSLGVAGVGLIGYAGAPADWPRTSFFLLVLGLSGAMNFLAVTLPAKTGGFLSDRGRLQVLMGGGPPAERAAANALLMGLNFSGTRPRDWPAAAIDALQGIDDASFDDLIGRLSFVVPYQMDRGDLEAAAREVEYVQERGDELPAILQPSVWLESAVVAARRGDNATARGFLERIGDRAFVEKHDRARAKAAVLAAEGLHEQAAEAARVGIEAMAGAMPVGTMALTREQLEELAGAD